MDILKTPEHLKERANEFIDNSWKTYTVQELGSWVHLFLKRAAHRSPDQQVKIKKDIADAQNYLTMMQAHVNYARETLTEPNNEA